MTLSEHYNEKLANEILEYLAGKWPEALDLREIQEEFNSYDSEIVRLNCVALFKDGSLNEDCITKDGAGNYRFSPGDDSTYIEE